MTASIIAEAIRNRETIHSAKERIAAYDHVARHYRDLALPALAAAARRVAAHRANRAPSRGTAAHPLLNILDH